MIVISDTSPLNYLVLIGKDHILPILFGTVLTTPAVLDELKHTKAPPAVRAWAASPPDWLAIRSPAFYPPFHGLGPGESDAIALAQQIQADTVLIDERDGTLVARKLGLNVAGTLNILDLAAEKGLLLFHDAIKELRRTTFRMPETLIAAMLKHHEDRGTSLP